MMHSREATARSIFENFVDGRWTPSTSGRLFENRNPADNDDLIGVFQESTPADAERAIAAAQRAYESWRLVPAPRRAEMLFRAAQLIAERKEQFARDMTREMGKVLEETRGDVQEAIDMTFFMAGEGRRQYGQTVPSELRDKFAMSVRQPLGVCGIITPWNFPMAIPSWKIIPALVCGNTVVFKPSSLTPLSAVNFVKVLEDAGIPPGVVNMVTGGADVGTLLSTHDDVTVVSFTGSTTVGRLVNQNAAPGFKKVHLEMGGKNIVMVMDDAQLELAIEGCVWGGFGTTGQRCTATSRLIIQDRVHDEFLSRLVDRARSLKLGDGRKEGTDVGPLINENSVQKVERYVDIGQSEGADLLCGGQRPQGNGLSKGFFFEPTIFTRVQPGMRLEQEEIFGPVLSVVRFRSADEAFAVNNDVKYGLSSSVYTRDVNIAMRAMNELDTGITYINAPTIGAEAHLPFGGVKQTGNGHREGGWEVYEFYSETKVGYLDFSGSLQRAQIDNYLGTPD